MYAFQPGLQSEAAALWAHKGVTDGPHHAALWQKLAAWACPRSRSSGPPAPHRGRRLHRFLPRLLPGQRSASETGRKRTLFRQREVPNGVLDALIANPSIRLGACNLWRECSFTVGAMTAASLDRWIAAVTEQPLAIRWALNKPLLNPVLLQSIEGRAGRAPRRPQERNT
jgi:hypothetical protein